MSRIGYAPLNALPLVPNAETHPAARPSTGLEGPYSRALSTLQAELAGRPLPVPAACIVPLMRPGAGARCRDQTPEPPKLR
jgi:hypothetical protein